MFNKKTLAALLLLSMTLVGCASKQTPAANEGAASQTPAQTTTDITPAYEDGVTTRIAALKGATTMGLVKLANDAEGGGNYQFDMYVAADEIVPLIAKGETDIALVPANLAATLYQKTEGQVAVIDINTLSVLEVLSGDEAVQSIADIKGKTVYMTGKGAVPEYSLRYVLEKNGLTTDDVTIEFKAEPTEVVAAFAADPTSVAVLPQPFATVAMTQQGEAIKSVIHLGSEWEKAATDGSKLVTGVTIVRKQFLKEHPGVVARFLEDHAASVDYVNANAEEAAALIEKYDIVKAAVAQKAIANCNLVSITGEEMKTALSGYLQALYALAPEAVGGTLPDEAFYYLGA